MELLNSQFSQSFASHDKTSANRVGEQKGINTQSHPAEAPSDKSVDKSVQANAESADKKAGEGDKLDFEAAAQQVEAFLKVQSRNLSFSVDEKTNRSVVTVKDGESGTIVRQIPSEEVLRLAERIQDLQQDVGKSVGVLLSNKV
ncbi:flagellar protein FlaG [Alteromonas ponticola]|uniref:Flagellar protein FlaG n=1 Tax=Alteromonas aquimaris TaxID=2998417 RepID=A0ABT3P493_9ALTE|nr:flagellar protein FlaG [Alteromonas aquimaris]MCW8107592.1 flagellar protein FlaG [Alteromonas aquimaris]